MCSSDLIVYQIILANYNVIEGLKNKNSNKEYKDYPPNALILAQQNAGNIEYLKKKTDDLQKTYDQQELSRLENRHKLLVDSDVVYFEKHISLIQSNADTEMNGLRKQAELEDEIYRTKMKKFRDFFLILIGFVAGCLIVPIVGVNYVTPILEVVPIIFIGMIISAVVLFIGWIVKIIKDSSYFSL